VTSEASKRTTKTRPSVVHEETLLMSAQSG